ncbi:hypothetical protein [Microbacterium sp.]|uniref:hypothetical protein n=1 Tax=Microbacterium sp. TaxID=51671 RepID=UPI0026105C5B|nr:hypothetical protein [Microbacterium sp.]
MQDDRASLKKGEQSLSLLRVDDHRVLRVEQRTALVAPIEYSRNARFSCTAQRELIQ